jgi:hypothetical protein
VLTPKSQTTEIEVIMARGRKNLSNEQTVKLREIQDAHSKKMIARAELRAQIEEEFRTKLASLEMIESIAMNNGLRVGLPKSVISQAVSQTNWESLHKMFALGSSQVSFAPELEKAEYIFTPKIPGLQPHHERRTPTWGSYIIREFEFKGRVWNIECKGGIYFTWKAETPTLETMKGDPKEIDELVSRIQKTPFGDFGDSEFINVFDRMVKAEVDRLGITNFPE